MGRVAEELKQKRINRHKAEILCLTNEMDRQFEIIQEFEVIKDTSGPLGDSIRKMLDQYRLQHKKVVRAMEDEFDDILGIQNEKTYTKKEIQKILLRRDGKLNDWLNYKK